jgi:hypothetical protein
MTSRNTEIQVQVPENFKNLLIVEPDRKTILISGVYEVHFVNSSHPLRRTNMHGDFRIIAEDLLNCAFERGKRAESPYKPQISYDVSDNKLPFKVLPSVEESYSPRTRDER